MQECPICAFPCRTAQLSPGGGKLEIDCVRCGKYAIGRIANELIRENRFSPDQVANVSGYIRQNPGFLILEADLERLRSLPTPFVGEKAANLLMSLGKACPQPGTFFEISHGLLGVVLHNTASVRAGNGEYSDDSLPELALNASKWMGVASASSAQELAYLLNDFLKAQGFLTEKGPRFRSLHDHSTGLATYN